MMYKNRDDNIRKNEANTCIVSELNNQNIVRVGECLGPEQAQLGFLRKKDRAPQSVGCLMDEWM